MPPISPSRSLFLSFSLSLPTLYTNHHNSLPADRGRLHHPAPGPAPAPRVRPHRGAGPPHVRRRRERRVGRGVRARLRPVLLRRGPARLRARRLRRAVQVAQRESECIFFLDFGRVKKKKREREKRKKRRGPTNSTSEGQKKKITLRGASPSASAPCAAAPERDTASSRPASACP